MILSRLRAWLLVALVVPLMAVPVSAQTGMPIGIPAAATSPPKTLPATPIAVDIDQARRAYEQRVEEVTTRGRVGLDALLAGDAQAIDELLSPEMRQALGSIAIAGLLATYATNRVHAELPEVNAVFDGHVAGTTIDGVFVQGIPLPFSLTTEDAQDGGAPEGRWSGRVAVPTGDLEIAITFADEGGALTATLDIPAQNLSAQPLREVRFTAEQPIGPRTAERALPVGTRNTTYTAEHTWGAETLQIVLTMATDGTILGLTAVPGMPLPPDPLAGYTSPVTYQLPFDGTWWVVWGGDTELLNYHAATAPQRHASDIMVWRDGATHRGDGARNEDYRVWSQPVLAPAEGQIVAVVDGQPDNLPGQVGGAKAHPAGNHVVIRTAADEYVFLAHLQRDTIQVVPGDTVAAGDLLGLAGNSGNSSEPHLHNHIQTVADFFDPTAQGVPLRFSDYVADGQAVADGVPQQGEFIAPRGG